MIIVSSFFEYIKENTKQWPQYLAMFSACISFFMVGACYGWSSPSLAILQSEKTPYAITNSEASWIASSLPFGCIFGAIISAALARHIGPKNCILLSSIPFLIGFLLIVFSNGAAYLIASRLLCGMGNGFSSTAIPIYAGEIAEDKNRGSILLLMTILLVIGSLFVTCLAPYISIFLTGKILSAFPIILLLTFLFMPDSHYFLVRSGKYDKAMLSLKWFRRHHDKDALQTEIDNAKNAIRSEKFSVISIIKQSLIKPNLKALLIVSSIQMAEQFSGNLPVGFYQEQIYKSAKVPMRSEVAVIVSDTIGIIAIFISMGFVDRWGRKPLLIVSSAGCAIATMLLGTYYQLDFLQESYPIVKWLPVIAITMFLCFFAFGLAPIPFIVIGEIFSSTYKESAMCIVQIIGALLGTIVTKLFQVVKDNFGASGVFYSLSCISICLIVVNIIIVPETSKKSLIEIQNMLQGTTSIPCEERKKESTQL